MSMSNLATVAEAVQGKLFGADSEFEAVSTDTRSLQPGDLFFALSGERFDAGEFVTQAGQLGAAGAVVDRHRPDELAQIEVSDTRAALGRFAAFWRARFDIPVVGVTGSTGKTTVKEMLAAIFRAHEKTDTKTLVTQGNLNNEIGLPLTVLGLRSTHSAAVLEMGAGNLGDIAYLAEIAAPTIGIVTNAGAAHLKGFGSEQGVAETKGEMFSSLSSAGTAIVNRDDRWFDLWCGLADQATVVSFGRDAAADYRAVEISEISTGSEFSLRFSVDFSGEIHPIELPMAGRHNVMNALAAIAATRSAGISWDKIKAGLLAVGNVPGRMRSLPGPSGANIIDDTYNANPVSVRAAIEFLSNCPGERWLVLGDMAELGRDSDSMHRDVGARAQLAGIDRLFAYGDHAALAAIEFGAAGHAFDSIESLVDAMLADLQSGTTVLVKGSRCMAMERVVDALAAQVTAEEVE